MALLGDYSRATEVLGLDGDTAYKMWNGGGVKIMPSEWVGLATDDGPIAIPALKLLEVSAKSRRGLFKANGQDFAKWSKDTAKWAGDKFEQRAKDRIKWLERLVNNSATNARSMVAEYLDGADLARANAVISALEFAGDGMISAVTTAEGLRVGTQKGAINLVGDVASLAGSTVAGAGEIGSDALGGRALQDLAIEYDHFDHSVRVTIDAAPEIATIGLRI